MSTVNPLSSGTAGQVAGGSNQVAPPTKEIGKTEFLELLVTQLKNQDPMNPVNNEQFIAQMASFSSLEQLISINAGITKLAKLTE